jgi:hypothetical protein
MPQMFAKRFWGFDPSNWPIVSFGLEANRDALINASNAGDVVLFVGTQSEPTEPEDQGRLLGIAEIGRLPIDSLQVLNPAVLRPIDYDAQGRLKWPKAIPMLRAWRLLDRPLLTDVLRAQLTYEATTRAILLDEHDQSAVLALRRHEEAVPDLEVIRRQRELADAFALGGPTRGPVPTSWTGLVSRDATSSATTYAFRFGRRDVWKIGHAQDIAGRLADVNRHVPHEALGEHWVIAFKQSWANQTAAYEMEQRVLSSLSGQRSEGERVICTEAQMRNTWIAALVPARQKSP